MLKDFFKSKKEPYFTPKQTKLIANYLIDVINDPLLSAMSMYDAMADSGKDTAMKGAYMTFMAKGGADEENQNIPASKKADAEKSIINYLNKHNAPLDIYTDYDTPLEIRDMLKGTDIQVGIYMMPFKTLINITNKDVRFRSEKTDQKFSMEDLETRYVRMNPSNSLENVNTLYPNGTRAHSFRSNGKER